MTHRLSSKVRGKTRKQEQRDLRDFVGLADNWFKFVSIYIPDGENGNVKAIHFAVDEAAFEASIADAAASLDEAEDEEP